MARRGKNLGLWWLVALFALIVFVPKEVWVLLGVLVGVAGCVYFYLWMQRSGTTESLAKLIRPKPSVIDQPLQSPPDAPTLAELMGKGQRSPKIIEPPSIPAAAQRTSQFGTRASAARPGEASVRSNSSQGDELHRAPLASPSAATAKAHALPAAPPGYGDGRWVLPDEVVEIAGLSIAGGMFYLGARLAAADGSPDPCLISALPSVARHGDFRERQTNYWPSYADISSSARRAYLNWLADERSHPDCDLGYVFLFFYGLERRVVLDSAIDPTVKAGWPAIAAELRRLLGIYGERSGSLRRYAGELLDWMEIQTTQERLYTRPIPDLPRSYEIPRYLRLALGQAAVDRAPIPAPLALAWVRLNPDISLRTAATRCPEEFGRLFVQRYHELLGSGLVLPKNRTKLKFDYQPASAGFHGTRAPTLTFGDVPDPTALTAPVRMLKEITDQCTDELAAFSRSVGKDAGARDSLDGLLQLPASLWPVEARAKLGTLVGQMQDGLMTLSLSDLVSALGGSNLPFNRERVRGLARALEASAVGMEPHVLAGARIPSSEDPIVLFSSPSSDAGSAESSAYQAAALTLQLASAVAQADGAFNSAEVAHLQAEIENWKHLTPAHQTRLRAHLRWLQAAPVTLASLKKKLDPLDQKAKETVATFMATLAQADGSVSAAEVRFLEKVYKALGVEPKRVFTDVHSAGNSSASRSSAPASTKGFKLDPARIAELQQDTARVSALLAGIFKEDDAPAPAVPEEPEDQVEPGLMGLDTAHTALVRLLLSRPLWTRAELEDAAADLELMLDGALEQVNEASFDAFDLPLTDGEDPVEVSAEVVEKIEQ